MSRIWIPSRNVYAPPRKLLRGAWNIDMRPLADSEPAPEEDFYVDTFSTGNKSKTMNGVAWRGNGTNCSVVSYANPFSSNFAMRFRVPIKDGNGEAWTEQRIFLGSASAQ